MSPVLDSLLRTLYSGYVPEPVRNSLRLYLTLLQRDREPQAARPPARRRIVALAPHMDDEVFGCGGTLAACVERGAEVTVVYVTDGSKGYAKSAGAPGKAADEVRLVARRKEEAQRAATTLGLADPVFLDLPDGRLAVTREAVGRLAAALRRLAPEVVFLPFFTDIHHDHWLTNSLFVEAVSQTRAPLACWAYEVWTPLPANTVVDITDTMERKRLAMDAFVSQRVEYDYMRAIDALNRYRSLFTTKGTGFAEAFYVADLALYRRLYHATAVGHRCVRAAAVA
jgi:N-acetylglucosamine malate deacetylase 1